MLSRWLKQIWLVPLLWAASIAMSVTATPYVLYAHRWMISELPPAAAKPPLFLVWERSPTLFESWNPAGFSEWQSRRIALTENGLITVIRKTLYVLDPENGRTIWTLSLRGNAIADWKVIGNLFVYTSGDSVRGVLRAAVDLKERKELWQTEPTPSVHTPYEIIPTPNDVGIFVSDTNDKGINDAIIAVNLKTSHLNWRSAADVDRNTWIPFSWFIYGEHLYGLVAPKSGGISVKSFALDKGDPIKTMHIFGSDNLGNLPQPAVLSNDGILFVGYNKRLRPARLALAAYDITSSKLLWTRDSTFSSDKGITYFRDLLREAHTDRMVATIWPNRFITFEPKTGSVVKDTSLPAKYTGWSERNASLLSYPYLFTGARRQLSSSRMAFDLIALNLETGKIDWSYEIETQNGLFTTPTADILNFILDGDRFYVARSDAKIMSFRLTSGSSETGRQ